MRACQIANDKLSIDVESFQAALDEMKKATTEQTAKSAVFSDQRDHLLHENEELQKSVQELNASIVAYCDETDSLKASLKLQSSELAQRTIEILALDGDKKRLQKERDNLEESIPTLIESSDLVRNLLAKIATLEHDLEDKRQAIRLLQLRSNEMKKMLQKELKSETTDLQAPSIATATNGAESSTTSSPSPTRRARDQETPSPLSGHLVVSDVSIKYLRNVIFKFLTSPEDEAKQMTKAVATLLSFTSEEERLLHEYLDWKASWFGSKPKITHYA